MDNFGISFSPLGNQSQSGPGGSPSAGGASNPVQDAIRTLSYRQPRTVGGGAPINASLLNAQGAAGLPQASAMATPAAPTGGLEEILRKLFGLPPQMAPQAAPEAAGAPPAMDQGTGMGSFQSQPQSFQPMMGGSAMSTPPPPRFTPGITAGEPAPSSFNPGSVQDEMKPLDPGLTMAPTGNAGEFQTSGSAGFPSPGRGSGASFIGRAVRR